MFPIAAFGRGSSAAAILTYGLMTTSPYSLIFLLEAMESIGIPAVLNSDSLSIARKGWGVTRKRGWGLEIVLCM